MLKSIYAYILIACALLGLGAGLCWYALAGTLARQKAQISTMTQAARTLSDAAKKDRALVARLSSEKAALARSDALARQSLERSLAAQPDWASQPVPKEVQDALQAP